MSIKFRVNESYQAESGTAKIKVVKRLDQIAGVELTDEDQGIFNKFYRVKITCPSPRIEIIYIKSDAIQSGPFVETNSQNFDYKISAEKILPR